MIDKRKSRYHCKRTVNFLYWNVRGFSDDKLNDPVVSKMLEGSDFIFLSETHCKPGENIHLSGYKSQSYCRPISKKINRSFGGISILFKKELEAGVKILRTNPDYIWLELSRDFFGMECNLYICCVYIPPENSPFYKNRDQDTLQCLENDLRFFTNVGHVKLVGDFNARTGVLPDFIKNDKHINSIETGLECPEDHTILDRHSEDKITCTRGKNLIDICIASRLRILNGRTSGDSSGHFTCHNPQGSSVVDYTIANEEFLDKIIHFQVDSFMGHLSDHCPVSWTVLCNYSTNPSPVSKSPQAFPKQYKWDQTSIHKYQAALTQPDITNQIKLFKDRTFKHNRSEIDEAVSQFSKIIQDTAKKSLTTKKIKKTRMHKKWFDKDLMRLKRGVLAAAKSLQKCPNDPKSRQTYYTNLRHYNKTKKFKAIRYKENIVSDINELHSHKSSEYWKRLNELKQAENCTEHADKIPIKEWEHYFKKLHQGSKMDPDRKNAISAKLNEEENCKMYEQTDNPITEKEIRNAVKNLKNNKSTGLDQISNEMIKYSQHVLLPLLCKLFNLILSSGFYPKSWKEGYIVPIFKSNNPLDPTNYRGITILNCLGKLFNNVLNNRLNTHFENNKIIDNSQIGFSKNNRASDHIYTLKTLIDKYTKNKKKLFTCFIDFKKAFDSVDHQSLLYKLKRAGIGDFLFKLMKDMYTRPDPTARVKIKDQLTEMFKILVGVNQGDPLSPTLFNLYINDIHKYFDEGCHPVSLGNKQLSCLLYADDLVILSQSKEGLQNACNKLAQFCKDWALEVNLKKSNAMIFTANGRLDKTKFTYMNQTLECTKSYKYLGIQFCSSGKFTMAKEDLYKRGLKATFKLTKLINSNNLSYQTSMHLFDHTIKPVLLYCSEVWAPLNRYSSPEVILKQMTQSVLEKCHLKFLRFTLGVGKKAPNMGIYGETGRKPIYFDTVAPMIKYWHRMNTSKDGLLYQAFQDNLTLNEKNKICWTRNIHELVEAFQLPQILQADLNKSAIKSLVSMFKFRLSCEFDKKWQEEVNRNNTIGSHGNKLRTYKLFKSNPGEEKYLSILKNKRERSLLTKFRISAHKLNIEILRYLPRGKRIPPEQRLCKLCTLDNTEDEKHFLIECPFYKQDRDKMFNNIIQESANFRNLSANDKFIWCLLNEDENVIKEIASFLKVAFSLRDSHG